MNPDDKAIMRLIGALVFVFCALLAAGVYLKHDSKPDTQPIIVREKAVYLPAHASQCDEFEHNGVTTCVNGDSGHIIVEFPSNLTGCETEDSCVMNYANGHWTVLRNKA